MAIRNNHIKLFLFCGAMIYQAAVTGQIKVTITAKVASPFVSSDSVFLSGNFNSWNPHDVKYHLPYNNQGEATIVFSLPQGLYEYKLTRGSWQKVETDIQGNNISNRILTLYQDTSFEINIAAWSDNFAKNMEGKNFQSTASGSVKILDSAFYMPSLNRYRRIWIYMPPDYETSFKKYPVLYMHDGQNLFDDYTSFSGEWQVDESLDSLFGIYRNDALVIGIDNGGEKRMTEYNPWTFQNYGKGEGDAYVDFIVHNLKPFVDTHYRTLKNKSNTFIAGSSMGGLISLYAVAKYPKIFGAAGIFSPAFWTASGIDEYIKNRAKKINSKLFFYAGGKEGASMIPDMQKIETEISSKSPSTIKQIIDEDAGHNEAAWKKYFPIFFEWIMVNK